MKKIDEDSEIPMNEGIKCPPNSSKAQSKSCVQQSSKDLKFGEEA